MKRQLQLPGVRQKPPAPPVRAKRDLTEAEFRRALERHGIRQAGAVVFVVSVTRNIAVEAEHRTNPIRVNRRATLAKLMRVKEGAAR